MAAFVLQNIAVLFDRRSALTLTRKGCAQANNFFLRGLTRRGVNPSRPKARPCGLQKKFFACRSKSPSIFCSTKAAMVAASVLRKETTMQIGTFKADANGYEGDLHSLLLSVPGVSISRVVSKASASTPDFAIIATRQSMGDDFDEIEIGAAWQKTSKSGKPYLSVKLDDPTLPAPIHCALIEHHEHFALVWNRDSNMAAKKGEAAT